MTCAHAGCTCSETTVVVEGKAYCSPACAHDSVGRSCTCGHAGCHASASSGPTANPSARPKPMVSPTNPTAPSQPSGPPEKKRKGR